MEVEWEDSIGAGGWFTPENYAEFSRDTEVDGSICYTAGYLVKSNRKHVIVCQSLHGSNYGAPLSIPRRMVRAVRPLK